MPAILLPILMWIITHPDQALSDAVAIEEAMVKAITGAIAAWRRWQAGLMTDAELKAAWEKEGVKVDEANAAWEASKR